jgi:uncharacterized membrane protein YbaN (DUF454 family)
MIPLFRTLRGRAAAIVLRAAGAVFFAVGAVGIVVPLLPTVVFWILAVWCWSASAPEWSERVLAHPHFGPPVRDFVEHRLMRRRAKVLAIGAMVTGYAVSVWAVDLDLATAGLLAVPIALVAIYLATRRERLPEAPKAQGDRSDSVLN